MSSQSDDASELVLYVAVHKDDVAAVEHGAEIPRRLVGMKPYIGFRSSPGAALERVRAVQQSVGAPA